MTPPRVLIVAGSDSGGGAGIQADIKTCFALGGHPATAVTALTAQNSLGVQGVWPTPVDGVREQIRSVLGDIGADAIKTGMLATAEIAEAVADELASTALPLVVDPVCVSTTGALLLTPEALDVYRERLFRMATVVTPNLPEVKALTGVEVSDRAGLRAAAEAVKAMGPQWVLIKGGHLEADAVDLLYDGDQAIEFTSERIDTDHTHGTGCTLASAVATRLAYGDDVPSAVQAGKEFVTEAIRRAYPLGSGIGPAAQWLRGRE